MIARTNKSLDLTWNLDLPDAIVEISLIPADTETQTFFTNSVKTLTELVPGTHYQIVMFPKFGETFGDYILLESGTFLGSYEFQTVFEDEVGSIFGTIKGRCSTLYATITQQDPPRTAEQPQYINDDCIEFEFVNDDNDREVTFYFVFRFLTPG